MIKTIGKVLLVLFSVATSVILTAIVYELVAGYVNNNYFLNPVDYQNRLFLYDLFTIYLPIVLVIVIFVINFIWLYKLTKRFPKLVIALVAFVIFGIIFLFKPFKISGGDVGPYKNGQTVLTHFKLGSIKLNNVVIFKRPDTMQDWTGYVVGVPGDKVDDAYYFPDKKFDGRTIPLGFYATKFGKGTHSWLVSSDQIKYIVWYAFKTTKNE